MSILELQSSKVLSNFQGKEHDQSNHGDPFKTIYPLERIIVMKYDFIEGRSIQIRQIDENTFEQRKVIFSGKNIQFIWRQHQWELIEKTV